MNIIWWYVKIAMPNFGEPLQRNGRYTIYHYCVEYAPANGSERKMSQDTNCRTNELLDLSRNIVIDNCNRRNKPHENVVVDWIYSTSKLEYHLGYKFTTAEIARFVAISLCHREIGVISDINKYIVTLVYQQLGLSLLCYGS